MTSEGLRRPDRLRSVWAVRPSLAAMGIMALAFVLRMRHLDRSLNIDEVRSVLFAGMDWRMLLSHLAHYELNMAPYYLILRLWLRLGSDEAAVRVLSVAAAILTFPALYALGTRFISRRVGLLSIFLLAISPLHIQHTQNARGYVLAVLLVVASFFFFLESTQRPSRWSWIGYVAASVLAVYTQFHAGLVLISQWISLPFLQRGDAPWTGWKRSIGAIVLLLIPAGLFVMLRDVGQIDWITRPGLRDLAEAFQVLAGGRWSLLILLAVLCAVAGRAAVRRDSPSPWAVVLLFSWLLVPILLSFALSIVKPVFIIRYLIVSLPALLLLASVGLSQIPWASVRVAMLVAVIALSVEPLVVEYRSPVRTEGYQQWRRATTFLLSKARRGDAVFVYVGEVRVAYDYYVRQSAEPAGLPAVVYPPDTYLSSPVFATSAERTQSSRVLAALPRRYRRVWLVMSHERLSQERLTTAGLIQRRLAEHYDPAGAWAFRGVRVMLFAR